MALAEAELCVWVRAAQHGRNAEWLPEDRATVSQKRSVSQNMGFGCEGVNSPHVRNQREWGVARSERQFSHAEGQMVAAQLLRFRKGGNEAERSDAL